MQYIPHIDIQTILEDRKEMEAFRESRVTVRWEDYHKVVRETEEDTFYCGICGHSPISTYPHSH